MKKILWLAVLFFGQISAQQVKVETLFEDSVSIRAIEIVEGKIWYAGTASKFGFVDIRNPRVQKQVRLSDQNLQFRTLGYGGGTFYTVNIESPAQFFRIEKENLKSAVVYTDTLKTAFYDALHFVNPRRAYAFSDPDAAGQLQLALFTKGNGWHKPKTNVFLKKGEAAFAASNSNIVSKGKWVWITTGGAASRIIRMNRFSGKTEIFETPFVQGIASQGIYAIDFYNSKYGIAVGGDYTKPEGNINNIAVTEDGGKTWQIKASGKNAGYSTCVRFRPGTRGREIVALGDGHISISKDHGATWQRISELKNLYTAEWFSKNILIAAGKDRIVKITFP